MGDAVLPGPIRQVGYVVRDLDRTIAAWLALGIGPWFTLRELPQAGCEYRGALSEPVLSIAFANSGDMQLELIQQQIQEAQHLLFGCYLQIYWP